LGGANPKTTAVSEAAIALFLIWSLIGLYFLPGNIRIPVLCQAGRLPDPSARENVWCSTRDLRRL